MDGKVVIRINDFFVHPGKRRHGYGRKIMEAAESEAKRLGAAKIQLHAFQHNSRAIALYKSLGFENISLVMGKSVE